MTTITYPARVTTTTTRQASGVTTVKGEWTKLRTWRTTWVSVGIAAATSLALAVVACAAQVSQWKSMSASERADFDATSLALIGVLFMAMILGGLGVRAMATEYSSGMIRVTLAAMPARRRVLVAKAMLGAAIAFPVALASNVVGFGLGQSILGPTHGGISYGHPGALRAIVFGALAVSLVVIAGSALGAIMRRTASAVTTLSAVILGTVFFGLVLPANWRQYLPGPALQAVCTVHRTAGLLPPVQAIAVLIAYAAVVLYVASTRIAVRDIH
jgi:ABC-2 type transport system permease protein